MPIANIVRPAARHLTARADAEPCTAFEITSTYKHFEPALPGEKPTSDGTYLSDSIALSIFNRTRPLGLTTVENAVKPLVESSPFARKYHFLQYGEERTVKGIAGGERAGYFQLERNRFDLPNAKKMAEKEPDAAVRLTTGELRQLPEPLQEQMRRFIKGDGVEVPARHYTEFMYGAGEHAMEVTIKRSRIQTILPKFLHAITRQGAAIAGAREYTTVRAASYNFQELLETSNGARPKVLRRTERTLTDGSIRIAEHVVPATENYTGRATDLIRVRDHIDDCKRTVASTLSFEDERDPLPGSIKPPFRKRKREVDMLAA